MKKFRYLFLLGTALILSRGSGAPAPAAIPTPPAADQADPIDVPVAQQQKFRNDTAAAVANGTQTAVAALAALKGQAGASGLGVDTDSDLGLASADVGNQLVGLGKPTEAGRFFAQAELSLAAAVAKIPDSSVQDKTQRLATLAFLRHRFLNKPAEAKATLTAALQLKPGDPYLTQLWVSFASENAEVYGKAASN